MTVGVLSTENTEDTERAAPATQDSNVVLVDMVVAVAVARHFQSSATTTTATTRATATALPPESWSQ
jgi:hypothetical protein